jgi:hypothetical protein
MQLATANSNQLAADAYASRLLVGTRSRRVKPTLLPCAEQQFGTQLEDHWRSCRRAMSESDVRSYQERGPFEDGSQVLFSSHCKLLSPKAMVVSVAEKVGT